MSALANSGFQGVVVEIFSVHSQRLPQFFDCNRKSPFERESSENDLFAVTRKASLT